MQLYLVVQLAETRRTVQTSTVEVLQTQHKIIFVFFRDVVPKDIPEILRGVRPTVTVHSGQPTAQKVFSSSEQGSEEEGLVHGRKEGNLVTTVHSIPANKPASSSGRFFGG